MNTRKYHIILVTQDLKAVIAPVVPIQVKDDYVFTLFLDQNNVGHKLFPLRVKGLALICNDITIATQHKEVYMSRGDSMSIEWAMTVHKLSKGVTI